MKNIGKVFALLKPYKKSVFILTLTAIIVSILSFLIPFISQYLFDQGLIEKNFDILALCVIALIIINIITSFVEIIQYRIETKIRNSIGNSLKADVFEHSFRLKVGYYFDHGYYKIVSDALNGVDNILEIFQENCLTIFVVAFKTIGACLGLFFLNWKLTFCVLVFIPIKYFISLGTSTFANKYSKLLLKNYKVFNGWITDVIDGIIDIKIWGLRKNKITELKNIYNKLNSIELKRGTINEVNSQIIVNMDTSIGYYIYLIGIYFIGSLNMSVGGLLAFVSYAGYLFNPLNIILDMKVSMIKLEPSFEEIERFFEMETEDTKFIGTSQVPSVIDKICFDDISYIVDGKLIIQNACFTIQRGEKIAIVGENGSGKTTLINMLLRLIEPTTGAITVNGIDISEFDIESYRNMFSVVMQSIHLFSGTVEDNIFINGKSNKSKDIDNFAMEFIEKLEKGANTKVGAAGMKLSGGERQKIALLRAIQRNAKIILLDEATANYDLKSEKNFNEFICKDNSYDFYFIITHRQEILKEVDKMIYIDSGCIEIREGKAGKNV